MQKHLLFAAIFLIVAFSHKSSAQTPISLDGTGIIGDNGYCDPSQFYVDINNVGEGMHINPYWGFWFDVSGFPNPSDPGCGAMGTEFFIKSIEYFNETDVGRTNPVWSWYFDDWFDCDLSYPDEYIPPYEWLNNTVASPIGGTNVYSLPPVNLKTDVTYVVRYEVAQIGSRFGSAYVTSYIDRDFDKVFDEFNIGYPTPNDGFDADVNNGEFIFRGGIAWTPSTSFPWAWNATPDPNCAGSDNLWFDTDDTNPIFGWNRCETTQRNIHTQFIEYRFGADRLGTEVNKELMHRHKIMQNSSSSAYSTGLPGGSFTTDQDYEFDPCIGYRIATATNFSPDLRYEDGHVLDNIVIFAGLSAEPFPADGDVLFAAEAYDGTIRQPINGGNNVLFQKPSVEFNELPPTGFKLKYQIAGPIPNTNAIYTGSDNGLSDLISLEVNDLQVVNTPDPNDPNTIITTYRWEASNAPVAAQSDIRYYSDAQGNILGDGSFFAFQSGVYALSVEVVNGLGQSDPSGVARNTTNFNVQTDYDLTISAVSSPLTNIDPFFVKLAVGKNINFKYDIANIGFQDVESFNYSASFFTGTGNFLQATEVKTWDYIADNGGQRLENGDEFEAELIGTSFQEVGIYQVVMGVTNLNGTNLDQSQANNYRPIPTAGTSHSSFIFGNPYTIEVAYQSDLVGDQITYPQPVLINDFEKVIEGRPFRPVIRFANLGIEDDFDAQVTVVIKDENNNEVDFLNEQGDSITALIESIEDVPAGRFNKSSVEMPQMIMRDPGVFTLEATIKSVSGKEPVEAEGTDNTITGQFTVEPGLEGVYTIGNLNTAQSNNYTTIEQAVQDMYLFGISDDIVFEFTDAEYNLVTAIDLRTTIVGLGEQENGNINTITFRAAPNRALIRGGVKINIQDPNGIGFWFGQELTNSTSSLASANQSGDPEFFDFKGYINFDGGELRSINVNLDNNQEGFAAPFFLDYGTQNVSINGIIITNDNTPSLQTSYVEVPLVTSDGNAGGFEFGFDQLEQTNGGITTYNTYSAGIVNRSRLYLAPGGRQDLASLDLDTIPNSNNVFTNNEISDFGYGIVSLGIGVLFAVQNADKDIDFQQWYNFNNENNTYSDNLIYNVGRAGIAIGNEQNSTIQNNTIHTVNPDGISTDANGASYDHAGIMIGGLVYTEPNGVKNKGYYTRNIWVDGNKINEVSSSEIATGIKVEQVFDFYGIANSSNPAAGINMPDGEDNIRVTNNIVKNIKGTTNTAHRFGIRLFTERTGADNSIANGLASDFFNPETTDLNYRTRNDWITNNTVLISSNDNNTPDQGLAASFGLLLQQTSDTKVYNNVFIVDDNNLTGSHEFAASVFVQGQLPQDGGLSIDNNAYHVTNGTALVRFVEMNNNDVEHVFDRIDFENLEQWRAYTGSDKNSIEYNPFSGVIPDYMDTENGIMINVVDGELPIGSKLNNRGKNINWLDSDIDGNLRGLTGTNFDIGAHEFEGRLFLDDIETIRFESPSAYRASQVEPTTGLDFTNAEHILTTPTVQIEAMVRNDGGVIQTPEFEIEVSIESRTVTGNNLLNQATVYNATSDSYDYTPLELNSVKNVAVQISSSNNALVNFGEFTPETYSEFLNKDEPYTVPAQYRGMENNVTPLYRVVMRTGSDQNNSNNEVVKYVRFFVKKATEDIMVSINARVDDPIDQTGGNPDLSGAVLNTSALILGLSSSGYSSSRIANDYDYDVLNRNGWEKFSTSYDNYKTLYWSDGGLPSNDGFTRFQLENVRDFIATGEEDDKVNLVIASQGLVNNIDLAKSREILRSESAGTALGATVSYAGETITGVDVSEDRVFEISNPTNSPAPNAADLNPYPTSLQAYNASGQGIARNAYHFDRFDENTTISRAAGISLASVNYNMIYIGMDWRHFGASVANIMRGILDFNQENVVNDPIGLSNVVEDFRANQQNKTVKLEWTTTNETGISSYSVERTQDENFVSPALANIDSKGISSLDNNYDFIDNNVEFGETYNYRLRLMDSEGGSRYSEIRSVTILGADGTNLNVTIKEFANEIRVINNGTSGLTLDIKIYDMAGNSMIETTSDRDNTVINTNKLGSGYYNVVVSSGAVQVAKPLVITK